MQRSALHYPTRRNSVFNEVNGLIVLNAVVLLVVTVLAMGSPSSAEWMTAAIRAEMIGSDLPAAHPTQLAQPVLAMQSVRAN
jgi:hypothetical protein